MNRRLVGSFAAASAAVLWLPACSDLASERDVRMTLVDSDGLPVPGALFYAEVREPGGEPFAFFAYRAGPSGAVPDQAREAAKIGWRPGAEVAMAAFAPDRRPSVALPGADPPVPLEGGVLVLDPGPENHPDLVELRGLQGSPPAAAAHLPRDLLEALMARLEPSRGSGESGGRTP